jgi:hypothetical protein
MKRALRCSRKERTIELDEGAEWHSRLRLAK